MLTRVAVETGNRECLRVFYTNLWKALLFPRFLTEVNKTGAIIHRSPHSKKIELGQLVTDSGFWDSYRTVYPLLSIVCPEKLGLIIDGWVNWYRASHPLDCS